MSAENKETRPRSKQIEAKTKTEREEGNTEDAVSSASTGRNDEHKIGPRARASERKGRPQRRRGGKNEREFRPNWIPSKMSTNKTKMKL